MSRQYTIDQIEEASRQAEAMDTATWHMVRHYLEAIPDSEICYTPEQAVRCLFAVIEGRIKKLSGQYADALNRVDKTACRALELRLLELRIVEQEIIGTIKEADGEVSNNQHP